jgi:hypothetical protein
MKSAWIHLITTLALILAVLPVQAKPVLPQTVEQSKEALILLDALSQPAMQQAISEITTLGGKIFASFPNQGLFSMLTPAQVEQLRRLGGVRLVTFVALDPASAGSDPGAINASIAWNARLQANSISKPASLPDQPDNDARLPPDWEVLQSARQLSPNFQNMYQTSEYMLRNIQIDIFLPESNGRTDPNRESWTRPMRDKVVAEITNGVLWWAQAATQAGQPSAELTANLVFHTPFNEPGIVATSYEPIYRSSADQNLWMGEIMGHLGYTDEYFNAIRHYAHDRRAATGRDWAFTVWVVNSAADVDGKFNDGMFGYAYIYGPLVVMTYDNDGWGISNMEMVIAHEMGHIFGALDEYAASGCTDTQTSGYLSVANSNCENGSPPLEESIMRSATSQFIAYPARQVSMPARQMVGWRDSDGDALYDPIDTVPSLNLASHDPSPLPNSTPSWNGAVADIPYESTSRPELSINAITSVQFQLDGGSWKDCDAGDGAYDQTEETFTCLPSALLDGLHTVNIQGYNRAGNLSPLISESVLIDTTPPETPSTADPGCPADDGVWQAVCDDPSFTWEAAVDTGSGLAGYSYYWGKDSQGVSDNWTVSNSFDPPPLSRPGAYYLRLNAQDLAGNTSAWSTIFTFKYDASPPVSQFISIQPVVCAQSYFIRWSGDGTGSGIVAYDVQYRLGADGLWIDWLLGASQTSAFFGPASPVRPIPGQIYFFRLRAIDELGNQEDYPADSEARALVIQTSCHLYLPLTTRE